MRSDNYIPTIIIGGGIIGLTIARELLRCGNSDFCILDKAPYLGDHSSGRNSGVLHAGLYYPKDSLKKKFCIRGLKLWREFCTENNLFYQNCGKYIFTTLDKKDSLLRLYERAKGNGVDVRFASRAEVEAISNYANAEIAFFSPTTSIVDPSEVVWFLKNHLEKCDVPILLNQNIEMIKKKSDGFLLKINGEEIHTSVLINAAGLGAVGIREKLGLTNVHNTFVKGHYVRCNKRFFNESLLYPIPHNNLKGLGVHTCIDSDGSIKFGPDVRDSLNVDYSLNQDNVALLKKEVVKNFKVSKDDLREDYLGVRSKITIDGELFTDFYIGESHVHGLENYIELLGIESPGLTSSLAIAEYVCSKLR